MLYFCALTQQSIMSIRSVTILLHLDCTPFTFCYEFNFIETDRFNKAINTKISQQFKKQLHLLYLKIKYHAHGIQYVIKRVLNNVSELYNFATLTTV